MKIQYKKNLTKIHAKLTNWMTLHQSSKNNANSVAFEVFETSEVTEFHGEFETSSCEGEFQRQN